jgi:hypothetical protein
LLREAELKIVDRGEFLDSLVVLEEGMRHFYILAMQLKAVGGKPDELDANLLKAVAIAEKVMPYRHHRLAAIKLDKDPLPPGLRQDASLEELEAEMKKHWLRLAPVLDLEALMAPADGSATRDVPEDEPGGISGQLGPSSDSPGGIA